MKKITDFVQDLVAQLNGDFSSLEEDMYNATKNITVVYLTSGNLIAIDTAEERKKYQF